MPSLRRSLRLTSNARCAPALGTDLLTDDLDGGVYPEWPFILIEVKTKEGVVGRSYLGVVVNVRLAPGGPKGGSDRRSAAYGGACGNDRGKLSCAETAHVPQRGGEP